MTNSVLKRRMNPIFIVFLFGISFSINACRTESIPEVEPTSEANPSSQTNKNPNDQTKSRKSDRARKYLEQLGAIIQRKPFGKDMFTSVDLATGWTGKGRDLRFLADIDDLWELYLGPTITKDDFIYIYVLREVLFIGVSDTKLSKSEIDLLKRRMPLVRVFDILQSDQLIIVPSSTNSGRTRQKK